MRRLQSGASSFLLRVSMNFWVWGSRALLGGKRPVHSHSSCQPRSSLYLQGQRLSGQEGPQKAPACQVPQGDGTQSLPGCPCLRGLHIHTE